MRSSRKREKGFTLLEVLVATVIMGIAVVAIMSNLTTSMRTAARLTDYDRATLQARSKMDELLASRSLPLRTEMRGTWPVTQSGWRAIVTPADVPPTPAPGFWMLDRVELEIWWMNNGNRRTFNLEGYRRAIITPEDIQSGVLKAAGQQ